MIKKITQIGDNLAIIFDKGVFDILNISLDTLLEIKTNGENLTITPIREGDGGFNSTAIVVNSERKNKRFRGIAYLRNVLNKMNESFKESDCTEAKFIIQLLKLMIENKVTLSEFSLLSGISDSYLSELFRGEKFKFENMRESTFIKLKNAFNFIKDRSEKNANK